MFTKLKATIRDYFLPQKPNGDINYFVDDCGMYTYYKYSEPDVTDDEIGSMYDQPFIEKPLG